MIWNTHILHFYILLSAFKCCFQNCFFSPRRPRWRCALGGVFFEVTFKRRESPDGHAGFMAADGGRWACRSSWLQREQPPRRWSHSPLLRVDWMLQKAFAAYTSVLWRTKIPPLLLLPSVSTSDAAPIINYQVNYQETWSKLGRLRTLNCDNIWPEIDEVSQDHSHGKNC